MSNRGLIIMLAIVMAAIYLSIPNHGPVKKPENPLPQTYLTAVPDKPTKPSVAYGERIFRADCEVCHGKDGKTSMAGMEKNAANLTDKTIQNKTDAELAKIIHNGKPGSRTMVGRPWYKDYEVESIILFLRTLK